MKTASYVFNGLMAVCVCHSAFGGESDVDGDVVRAASELLLDEHLRQDVDQRQLSRAWARRYLLTLDPRRMHFLASDADEFMNRADSLLADAQEGQIEFPLLVAKRFRTRLSANAKLISRLLDARHDFTVDESVQIEYPTYAVGNTNCAERWRRRIKYELLIENPDDPGDENSRQFLRGRYSRHRLHFGSLTQQKILSLYVDALAKAFDPHSAYFDRRCLAMYRIGSVPNYTLGMPLAFRNGDLWILPSRHDPTNGSQSLTGCRIVAVRREGQQPIHLTGLTDQAATRTLISPIAELGHAKSVILDLDDPRSGRRITVVADRWLPGR